MMVAGSLSLPRLPQRTEKIGALRRFVRNVLNTDYEDFSARDTCNVQGHGKSRELQGIILLSLTLGL